MPYQQETQGVFPEDIHHRQTHDLFHEKRHIFHGKAHHIFHMMVNSWFLGDKYICSIYHGQGIPRAPD